MKIIRFNRQIIVLMLMIALVIQAFIPTGASVVEHVEISVVQASDTGQPGTGSDQPQASGATEESGEEQGPGEVQEQGEEKGPAETQEQGEEQGPGDAQEQGEEQGTGEVQGQGEEQGSGAAQEQAEEQESDIAGKPDEIKAPEEQGQMEEGELEEELEEDLKEKLPEDFSDQTLETVASHDRENYDEENGIITWEITLNANRLDLSDVTVTSTAVNALFGAQHEYLEYVVGSLTLDGMAQPDPGESMDGGAAVFELGDIGTAQASFKVRTRITEPDFLASNEEKTFECRADVLGRLREGGNAIGSGTAGADCKSDVLSKTAGEYNYIENKIPWTIIVNADKVNLLTDVTITDTIFEGQELADGLGGIQVEDADGAGGVSANITDNLGSAGFVVDLGDIGGKTVKITYATALTEPLPDSGSRKADNRVQMSSNFNVRPSVTAGLEIPVLGVKPLNAGVRLIGVPTDNGNIEGLVSKASLTTTNDTEIANNTEIGFDSTFKLRLDLQTLGGQGGAAVGSLTDLALIRKTRTYKINLPEYVVAVFPPAIREPLYAKSNIPELNGALVGHLVINGNKGARFEFAVESNNLFFGDNILDTDINLKELLNLYIELECRLDKDKVDDQESVEIDLSGFGGSSSCTIRVLENQPTDPKVTKGKGKLSTTADCIDWEVVVEWGKYAQTLDFKDTLQSVPQNLQELVDNTFKVDGNSVMPIESGGEITTTLTRPVSNDSNPKTTITYSTKLTEDAFYTVDRADIILNDGSDSSVKTSNTAEISWEKDGSKSASSSNDGPPMDIYFLDKGDAKFNAATRELEWTVTVDTHGQSFEYLYLIDTLDPGLTYNTGSITVSGEPITSGYNITPDNGTGETMTLKLLDDETPHKIDLIARYGPTLTITYSTMIVDESFFYSDTNSGGDYRNSAQLDYKWIGLDGTERFLRVSPEVGKNGKAVSTPISKVYAGYEKATGRITWTITVNTNKLALEDVVVTDTVGDGQQYVGYVGDSYTVNKNKAAYPNGFHLPNQGSNIQTFHLGDIGTNPVSFQIQTQITDKDFYAKNKAETFKNKVEMTGKVGVKNVSGSSEASQLLKSTVLEKEASEAYNYQTRSIPWTITVNSDKQGNGVGSTEKLNNVVVTDAIPKGQVIVGDVSRVKVTIGGVDKTSELLSSSAITYTVSNGGAPPDGSTDSTLTVNFGDKLLGRTAMITYETKLTDNFDFGAPKFTISNSVTMESDYGSTPRVSASVAPTNKPLQKGSEFIQDGMDYFIDYTVKVNQSNKAFPEGVWLKDTMSANLQVDMFSVALYKAEINAGGDFVYTENDANKISLSKTDIVYTKDGTNGVLQVKIPAGTKACVLVYSGVLYNYTSGSITNKIEFSGGVGAPNGESSNVLNLSSNQHVGGNATKYGSAEIKKVDATGKAALEGAEFTLYVYEEADVLKSNQNGVVISQIAVNKLNPITSVTTDANGMAKFKFLVPQLSKSSQYVIKETKAPEHYVLPAACYLLKLNENNQFTVTIVNTRTGTSTSSSSNDDGGGGGGGRVLRSLKPEPKIEQEIERKIEPEIEPEGEPEEPQEPEKEIEFEMISEGELRGEPGRVPEDEPGEELENEEAATLPAPTIESVRELDRTEALHPRQLPEGYSVVQYDDNTYIIFDEDGVPLGYVVLPDGVSLDDIDILSEMIPFGVPQVKGNPKTSDRMLGGSLAVAALSGAALYAVVMLRKRKRMAKHTE